MYEEMTSEEEAASVPGPKQRVSKEAFFFFEDSSPTDSASNYVKAWQVYESWGAGAQLSVYRRPCIAVQAFLIGDFSVGGDLLSDEGVIEPNDEVPIAKELLS